QPNSCFNRVYSPATIVESSGGLLEKNSLVVGLSTLSTVSQLASRMMPTSPYLLSGPSFFGSRWPMAYVPSSTRARTVAQRERSLERSVGIGSGRVRGQAGRGLFGSSSARKRLGS